MPGFIVRVDKAGPGRSKDYVYLTRGEHSDNWCSTTRDGAFVCETMEEVRELQEKWADRVAALKNIGITVNPDSEIDWYGVLPKWVKEGVRAIYKFDETPWEIVEIDAENRVIAMQKPTALRIFTLVEFMQNACVFRESRFEKDLFE